jgi:predicted RNA methylase
VSKIHTELIAKVGAKGAFHIGADIYPVSVVEVSATAHVIVVRFEKYKPNYANGHKLTGQQNWEVAKNPKGKRMTLFWNTDIEAYRKPGPNGVLDLDGWNCYISSAVR